MYRSRRPRYLMQKRRRDRPRATRALQRSRASRATRPHLREFPPVVSFSRGIAAEITESQLPSAAGSSETL